jgi:hypothetical protein
MFGFGDGVVEYWENGSRNAKTFNPTRILTPEFSMRMKRGE